MLQVLGLPPTTRLLKRSHWTVNRAKMSQSVGDIADPIKAIDEFGLDLVRCYLARVGGRLKDNVGESTAHLPMRPRSLCTHRLDPVAAAEAQQRDRLAPRELLHARNVR